MAKVTVNDTGYCNVIKVTAIGSAPSSDDTTSQTMLWDDGDEMLWDDGTELDWDS